MIGSRAEVRRAWARLPDASEARRALVRDLASSVPEERAELAAYLLDPNAGALLATTEARAAWLDGPLFQWIGPGNAAPHADGMAAVIAAPALLDGEELAAALVAARFTPRADEAVALAVAALPAGAQAAAVEMLFAATGPEPELLALSVVQCGRCVAWSPALLGEPIGERVVEALLALLAPARPRPLLDLVAAALGPIAARSGPLPARVREAALAGIAASTAAPAPASFSAELAAIGRTRALPDEDHWRALPRREVAAACAYILGFAAPHDRTAFADARARVLEGEDSDALLAPFLDGLVAAAHAPALCELVRGLLEGDADDAGAALGIAAQLPLDELASRLLDELESPTASRRALAAGAVALLAGDHVDDALARRLADPTPEVAAAAARVLATRGRRDLLEDHAAEEEHGLRNAIVRAALGELELPVIGELAGDALEHVGDGDASPIGLLLADALLCSVTGLAIAADLITGIPAAVGALALASVGSGEVRDVGVLAPPDARAAFAGAILRIATGDTEPEVASLALYLLARVSAGDETVADVIADALVGTDGERGNLVAALGEVRVATERTAAALAPLVAPSSPLGARIIAAAACGRALPAGHAAWAHVRELLALGTIARAAAWSAVRDRARR